jgi:hypothetical protein
VPVSRVSVASRVVNPKPEELHPAVSKELCQLRSKVSASCVFVVFRVVNCTRMSCIENYGYSNVQRFVGFYTDILYFTLYTIICIRTELLNDIDNSKLLFQVTVYNI